MDAAGRHEQSKAPPDLADIAFFIREVSRQQTTGSTRLVGQCSSHAKCCLACDRFVELRPSRVSSTDMSSISSSEERPKIILIRSAPSLHDSSKAADSIHLHAFSERPASYVHLLAAAPPCVSQATCFTKSSLSIYLCGAKAIIFPVTQPHGSTCQMETRTLKMRN